MKRIKTLIKMQEDIVSILESHKYKYMAIDETRVRLLIKPHNNTFNHAWKELVLSGIVEICGNEIRINQ